MKKIILFLIVLFTLVNVNAQNKETYNYERHGYVFSKKSADNKLKTKFTWKDSKGVEYPIYINPDSGRCFILKPTADGKERRSYLAPELSKEIAKELGIEFKEKKKNEK